MVLVRFTGFLSKERVLKGKDLQGKGECLLHGSRESYIRNLQLFETLQAVLKGMCSWKELASVQGPCRATQSGCGGSGISSCVAASPWSLNTASNAL